MNEYNKVNGNAIKKMLFTRPLELHVDTTIKGPVVVCTYQAAHYIYYRYTARGLNVVLLSTCFLFFFFKFSC